MEMIDVSKKNGDLHQSSLSQLIMLFMSTLGMWILVHSDYIYWDGTFDSAPSLFGQI